MAEMLSFILWLLFALLTFLAVTSVWLESAARRKCFHRLAMRKCSGLAWRSRCRVKNAKAVRQFLHLVVQEMGLPSGFDAKLRPADSVMDIYRWIYPPQRNLATDALELESLTLELQRHYGIDLTDRYGEDIRLGELFDRLHPSLA